MNPPAWPEGDEELVAGVLAGDREAFARVYERYADRLHDFAFSMVRNREEAADCVADSFVVMAEKLGQLRDPSSLRPWLYSVVRNECLRTLRGRARVAHDDEWLEAMPDTAGGPEQQVHQAAVEEELREVVWAAVEGLNDRDRALLDLHLRQGLEGAELATAMDVTPANSYVMLSRARDQVERSLGALLIARRGSDDCEPLAELLAGWDGRFSPLIRKRVARHIDGCETCDARRKLMVSPLALLGGVAAFAAPLELRDRVLEDERLVAHYRDDPRRPLAGAGASGSSGSPGSGRRALLATLAVVLVVLGGAAAVLWPALGDDTTATDLTTGAPLTSSAATSPSAAEAPSTGSGPTSEPTGDADSTAPAEPTAPSSPASSTDATTDADPAAPADLRVSTRTLRLGAARSGSVRLANVGGSGLDFAARPRASWLAVSTASGSIAAGGSTGLQVTVDRSALPEGDSSGEVAVTWAGGTVVIRVHAVVDRAPVVGPIETAGTDCTGRTVTATVTDAQGLRSVRLSWTGPSGSGQVAMSPSRGGWRAATGAFPVGGRVDLTVTATDRTGHRASRSRSIQVDPCPG